MEIARLVSHEDDLEIAYPDEIVEIQIQETSKQFVVE